MKSILTIFIFSFLIYSCSNSNAKSSVTKLAIIKGTVINEDTTSKISHKDSTDTGEYKFSNDELLGKIKVGNHPDFIKIEKKYTSKSKIYMRKLAYEAYRKMYAAAKIEGFDLKIISAFRSNYHQRLIWEAKWDGKRKVNGKYLNPEVKDAYQRAKLILQFSSMPGSSRHHWGADIDIYSLENSFFEKGHGLKLYQWMKTNAANYGFCQTYTAGREYGYNEEKWHWSYFPISKTMLTAFTSQISILDFEGFKGSQTADSVRIIIEYVLGINMECE